jgi:hypothetical protein
MKGAVKMINRDLKPPLDQKPESKMPVQEPAQKRSAFGKIIGPLILILVFGVIIFMMIKNFVGC